MTREAWHAGTNNIFDAKGTCTCLRLFGLSILIVIIITNFWFPFLPFLRLEPFSLVRYMDEHAMVESPFLDAWDGTVACGHLGS